MPRVFLFVSALVFLCSFIFVTQKQGLSEASALIVLSQNDLEKKPAPFFPNPLTPSLEVKEQVPDPILASEPNTKPAEPEPKKIQVSKSACLQLLNQQRPETLSTTGQTVASAQYMPNVSVTGQAVVPADLGSGYNLNLPDLKTLKLPISIDLEKNFPFLDSTLLLGDIPITTITFENGQVLMDGHLLNQDALSTLTQACASETD